MEITQSNRMYLVALATGIVFAIILIFGQWAQGRHLLKLSAASAQLSHQTKAVPQVIEPITGTKIETNSASTTDGQTSSRTEIKISDDSGDVNVTNSNSQTASGQGKQHNSNEETVDITTN